MPETSGRPFPSPQPWPSIVAAPPAADTPAPDPVVVPTGVTNTEPVRAANAVQSIPLAILTVLVAFHIWSPTDIEWAAILGLYTALSVKVSELARGKVWSPASVAAALAEANKAGPGRQ